MATPEQPWVIGHDHHLALGASPELIERWRSRHILPHAHFYRCLPIFAARLERRQIVGRGHLLALGATASLLRRWRQHDVLRLTPDRGFYSIRQIALASLSPGGALAEEISAEASRETDEAFVLSLRAAIWEQLEDELEPDAADETAEPRVVEPWMTSWADGTHRRKEDDDGRDDEHQSDREDRARVLRAEHREDRARVL